MSGLGCIRIDSGFWIDNASRVVVSSRGTERSQFSRRLHLGHSLRVPWKLSKPTEEDNILVTYRIRCTGVYTASGLMQLRFDATTLWSVVMSPLRERTRLAPGCHCATVSCGAWFNPQVYKQGFKYRRRSTEHSLTRLSAETQVKFKFLHTTGR